eukprot:495637_1
MASASIDVKSNAVRFKARSDQLSNKQSIALYTEFISDIGANALHELIFKGLLATTGSKQQKYCDIMNDTMSQMDCPDVFDIDYMLTKQLNIISQLHDDAFCQIMHYLSIDDCISLQTSNRSLFIRVRALQHIILKSIHSRNMLSLFHNYPKSISNIKRLTLEHGYPEKLFMRQHGSFGVITNTMIINPIYKPIFTDLIPKCRDLILIGQQYDGSAASDYIETIIGLDYLQNKQTIELKGVALNLVIRFIRKFSIHIRNLIKLTILPLGARYNGREPVPREDFQCLLSHLFQNQQLEDLSIDFGSMVCDDPIWVRDYFDNILTKSNIAQTLTSLTWEQHTQAPHAEQSCNCRIFEFLLRCNLTSLQIDGLSHNCINKKTNGFEVRSKCLKRLILRNNWPIDVVHCDKLTEIDLDLGNNISGLQILSGAIMAHQKRLDITITFVTYSLSVQSVFERLIKIFDHHNTKQRKEMNILIRIRFVDTVSVYPVLFGKLLDACNRVASVCVCSLNILGNRKEWLVDELNDVRTVSKWFVPRKVETYGGGRGYARGVEIRFTNATNIKMDKSAESYEEKRLDFDDIKEEEKANELSGTIGGGSMAGQSEFSYSNDGFRVLECV